MDGHALGVGVAYLALCQAYVGETAVLVISKRVW